MTLNEAVEILKSLSKEELIEKLKAPKVFVLSNSRLSVIGVYTSLDAILEDFSGEYASLEELENAGYIFEEYKVNERY